MSNFDDQTKAIQEALNQVDASAKKFYDMPKTREASDLVNTGKTEAAQAELLEKAMDLVKAIRGPAGFLMHFLETTAYATGINNLLEMGVFQAIPKGKSITADELSKKLSVDKETIVRFMRLAIMIGPIAEVGFEEYSHTPFSEIYVDIPTLSSVFRMMFNEYIPAWIACHNWMKENSFKISYDQKNTPYTYAHRTDGKDMWEYMKMFPERKKLWDETMAGIMAAEMETLGLFPFEKELGQFPIDEKTVVLCDVGGGLGHAGVGIRKNWPSVKGRFILQDLPEVISASGELAGVEKLPYDFFTPETIKGSLAYYIRRCLHDWPDDTCVKILKSIASGMEKGKSRLLIHELIIPERGGDPLGLWFDMVMICMAGKERTAKEWEVILNDAGLKLKKIWSVPGITAGIIEAELAY